MLDIPCRVAGGYFSSLGFVRKMGQSVFVGIMVLSIGILNLASVFIIKGYWSFTIWAISFGICYALPVSSQYSGSFSSRDLSHLTQFGFDSGKKLGPRPKNDIKT